MAKLIIILFFFLQPNTEQYLLEEGLRLEEQRNYLQALETWESALTRLERPSPAIAFEYLRVATEQGISDKFKTASSLYYWALSSPSILEEDVSTWEKELERILPLIDDPSKERLKKALELRDIDFFALILGFWQQMDPTPSSAYNERLLEHWQRIVYIRNEFDRNDNTVYGTDDRGTIFVRFGRPENIYTGNLITSRSDIESTCSWLGDRCGDLMVSQILGVDNTPYYEIWIYNPVGAMTNSLIFIFGESALSGFKRINAIDDFIPSMAFSFSDKFDFPTLDGYKIDVGSMSPGMVLQHVYYRKLASIDPFFGKQFEFMDKNWVASASKSPAELGPFQSPVFSQKVEAETARILKSAPEEKSSNNDAIPTIELDIHSYRLLAENGQPYFATFLQSRPYPAFIEDLSRNDEQMMRGDSISFEEIRNNYELVHGIQVMGEDGILKGSTNLQAQLELSEKGKNPSQSVFTIPWTSKQKSMYYFAELHNTDPGTSPKYETPFPNSLRGMGKSEFNVNDPLTPVEGELLLDDLIFGYGLDYEDSGNAFVPFYVSHDRKVPKGEALALHLEVYNLETREGKGNFRLEYEVTGARRLDWLRGREKEVSLGVSFQTQGSRFVDNLEIQTRDLDTGKYIFALSIIDLESGEKENVTLDFEVIEAANPMALAKQ